MGKFKTEGDQVMTNVLNDAKNKLSSKTMIILYLKKHRS
jgi:hypothetical protein